MELKSSVNDHQNTIEFFKKNISNYLSNSRSFDAKTWSYMFSILPGKSGLYCIYGSALNMYSFKNEKVQNLFMVAICIPTLEMDCAGVSINLYLRKDGTAEFGGCNNFELKFLEKFKGNWLDAYSILVLSIVDNWPNSYLSNEFNLIVKAIT